MFRHAIADLKPKRRAGWFRNDGWTVYRRPWWRSPQEGGRFAPEWGPGVFFSPIGYVSSEPIKTQARPSFPHFLQFLAVVLVSVLVWTAVPFIFRRREKAD